ncbi:hypothetical protein BCO26_2169 [Heyndrickxia coagulans 2-6]|nr:hypothetical protein BCO26_2169 [Heyndrickxia coagulans 2-6]
MAKKQLIRLPFFAPPILLFCKWRFQKALVVLSGKFAPAFAGRPASDLKAKKKLPSRQF